MWSRVSSTVALTAMVFVATACGDGATAARELEDTTEPSGGPATPGSEIPTGQDTTTAESEVVELLQTYDDVVNDIYADAAAVDDPGHELLDDLRDLFAPESEQVPYLVDGWVQDDGAGEEDDDAHFLRTELLSIESETEDRVSFITCVEIRLFLPDDASGGRRAVGYESQLGRGRAVRTGDGWLLDEVSVDEAGLCPEVGT